MQETWVQALAWEDSLEKGMATHSSVLAWRIPWTEDLALCNQLKYPSGKLIYKHISGIQYWDLAGLQHRPAGKKERHRRQGREGYPFSVHVKFGVYNSSTLGFLWGDFWGLPRHLLQLKHLGPDREGHAGPTPPTTGTA